MKRISTFLFIILWTIMALVLTVSAVLICAVRTFTPERLTPIVRTLANDFLDADVELSRIELKFSPAFPMLKVELDSLTIISHAFRDLPAAERESLPEYADTLLTLDGFRGTVNLGPLLSRGEISIKAVELVRPGVNIVLSSDGKANFDISKSTSESEDSSAVVLPALSIERFAFIEPKEIRYFNAIYNTSASILLLNEAFIDGHLNPNYHLRVNGRLDGPMARTLLNLDNLNFGLDGRVRWAPTDPQLLTMEDFTISGAYLNARLNTCINIDSTLTVRSADISVDPVSISEALSLLPDSLRRVYRLQEPYLRTDAAISMQAELTKPFCVSTDSVPFANVTIKMPECSLRYGSADFRKLYLDASMSLLGNDINLATVNIDSLVIAGPATRLDIMASASQLLEDPEFNVNARGNIDIRNLPPMIAEKAQGFLSGKVNMQLQAHGTVSMLATDRFHLLNVDGNLRGSDLYYLSNDTSNMADIHRLTVEFGTQERVVTRDGQLSAPTLMAKLKVDTVAALFGGVAVNAGALELGAGIQNMRPSADTSLVVPLGGGIKLGRLDVESITDSAGVRIRGVLGQLVMKRYKGNLHLPEIQANLVLDKVGAGTRSTRFLLSNAEVKASLHKKRDEQAVRKAIKHLADSISRVHPDLPPDSVYRLAIDKRRRRPGVPHTPRVHGEITQEDNEIIEWGISKGFRKFLYGWDLNGTLATRSARLFTPMFPLRNNIRLLDIAFSNDSIKLNSLNYKAGHSDMAVTGIISNIKRALANAKTDSDLKVNMQISSDTVDVNQLAAAAFAGAAYSERLRNGEKAMDLYSEKDDSDLDKEMDALISEHPDSVGPLLVPSNVDASIDIAAKNVMYSDLTLNTLGGSILMYNGGVSLHELQAVSPAGDVKLSALYAAPRPDDMQFGFGLQLERFNIERFLNLVPAIDSIMPLMRDFSGIINADIAATVDIDSAMNMELPTLDAAVKLSGDSLAFINPDTYRTLGKWLRFKDKTDNKIKHVSVELLVRDNEMHIFPFTFDIDRYRLGVMGSNDLALNFNYHIAVLKSPLPFKFGINISGNPDKYKVRFGGAKFKNEMATEKLNVVDTARVNLVKQIENVFRRGVRNSSFAKLEVGSVPETLEFDSNDDVLTPADSAALIREGLIPDPEALTGADDDDNTSPESEDKETSSKPEGEKAILKENEETDN